MKAMSITHYGGPEVVQEVDLPVPQPGPGEVSIDVTHASVGLIEAMIRRGMFADQPAVVKPPFVPGLEVVGTIRALGEGVSGLQVGEQVTTLTLPRQGAYAEVAIAPADLTVSIEGTGVSATQAVAGVANAATAYLALTEVGHLRPGQSVLVHGAIGGLASAFPAVARMLGASRVVGTVRSADKADAARALGLDDVVVSADFPAKLTDERFDVVIDSVGGQIRLDTIDLLAPLGRLLVVGNASGATENLVDTNRIWVSNIAVIGFSVGSLLAAEPERGVPAGRAVLPLLADGRLQLPVTVLPLADAAEAHRRMDAKEVTGRLLLSI
jgi:NADPH2:quinone reductase